MAPSLTKIRLQRTGYHFDRVTAGRWDPFLGLGFELMVSRNLDALLHAIDARDVVGRVGSYWHKTTASRPGVQIDLVIERDDNVTNLSGMGWKGEVVRANLPASCKPAPSMRSWPRWTGSTATC